MKNKWVHEKYAMDMLWAQGHGMQFKNYPRYADLMQGGSNETSQVSGQDILNEFIEKAKK